MSGRGTHRRPSALQDYSFPGFSGVPSSTSSPASLGQAHLSPAALAASASREGTGGYAGRGPLRRHAKGISSESQTRSNTYFGPFGGGEGSNGVYGGGNRMESERETRHGSHSRSGSGPGPGIRVRAETMPVKQQHQQGITDAMPTFSDGQLRKPANNGYEGMNARNQKDFDGRDGNPFKTPSKSAQKSQTRSEPATGQDPELTAGSLSLKVQETVLIEDILFVMMGIEGTFITLDPKQPPIQDSDESYTHRNFIMDDSLDPSLRDLVSRVLPLASIYLSLEAFVAQYSQFEYGFVNHALCAAIKGLIKEYLILIAQLETQFRTVSDFTLQKLWYHIQPTLQTLSSLDVLVGVIRASSKRVYAEDDIRLLLDQKDEGIPLECKGGSILGIIAAGMYNMSGDPVTKKLYGYLLNKASVPYIGLLESWIHKGEIHDPYDEFMIVKSDKVSKENMKDDFNDAYWDQKYTIRTNYVPSFLVPLQDKVLLAGKYLNVIQECGIPLSKVENETREGITVATAMYADRNEILASLSGGKLVDTIETAYQFANKKLLDLLLNEYRLLDRLQSMKRYFFLDQSDFFTNFLDLASKELKETASKVPLTRLQSLMESALRNPSSVTVTDDYKEVVKVKMAKLGLVEQLLRIINVRDLVQASSSGQGLGAAVALAAQHPGGHGERVESRASNLSGKPSVHSRGSSIGGTGGAQMPQHGSSGDSWQDEATGERAAMDGIVASSALLELPAAPASNKPPLLGIDALTLDYSVKFPLSLVISRKALTKYQFLFRHLVYLKHGERVLCETWQEHFRNKEWRRTDVPPEVKRWRSRHFFLRSKMMVFVQQLMYYVCSEVLEPSWREMATKLTKVSTVDEVLKIHSDFLDTCLNQCMLTNSKLLRIYSKLMSSCVKFASYTEGFNKALKAMAQLDEDQRSHDEDMAIDDAASRHSTRKRATSMAPLTPQQRELLTQRVEKAVKRLNEIEDGFIYHLKVLTEALKFYSATEAVQFLYLVVRLDYNQFYANQIQIGGGGGGGVGGGGNGVMADSMFTPIGGTPAL